MAAVLGGWSSRDEDTLEHVLVRPQNHSKDKMPLPTWLYRSGTPNSATFDHIVIRYVTNVLFWD